LEAYQKCSDLGWEAIIEYIQNKLQAPVKAELSKIKNQIDEYYNYGI
jgi:hypothetical protein